MINFIQEQNKCLVIVIVFLFCMYIVYIYLYGTFNPLYALKEEFTDIITPLTCPANMDSGMGLCYDKCPVNYSSDGADVCYENCPIDWTGTSNLSYCQKSTKSSPGKPITLSCNPGEMQFNGLCYKVPDGYTLKTPGIATKNCPIGQRDDGVSCLIDAKATSVETKKITDGSVPTLSCPNNLTNFEGLCYDVPTGFSMVSSGRAAAPCPNGQRDDGTNCWVDASNLTNCNTYGPGKSCPNGYKRSAVCTCQRTAEFIPKPTKLLLGSAPSLSCPSGKTNYQGLCYTVPADFSMKSPGIATKSCPSNQILNGTSCWTSAVNMPKPAQDFMKITGTVLKPNCPINYKLNSSETNCYEDCLFGEQRQLTNPENCTEICPNDMVDVGANCQKKILPRKSYPLASVGVCPGKKKIGSTCHSI